ncbi:MAG TPA: rod shape-determining protein MreD [Gemmatimonadaceae bacterium]|nr:rod shape-determining protein MreD [Gemmatimonadaceae bacterium]
MSGGRALRILLAFMMLVVLHFTLRPFLGWRTEPDFLTVALLLAAVRVRPGTAAVIGFLLGLGRDALLLEGYGSSAIAFAFVGFGAAWLKAAFFADNLALNGFFFFLGKWAYDVMFLIVERRLEGMDLAIQLGVWSPLSAAVTALAGVLVLIVMRPLLQAAPT